MRIDVQSLSARVHRTPLLEDITLRIEPGDLFGLIGPNGSGKSTLMRCLAGLHRPSAGRVLADGTDLGLMPARARAQRIAFVEQQADDGRWDNTPHWTPEPTEADGVEITVEFVMHMANILAYLEVGDDDG